MRHTAGGAGRPQQGPDPGPAGRSRWERVPYLVILVGLAAGLLWISSGEQYVRSGTLELAGVLLLAAVARMALPERRAGMLGARRRLADVVALTALSIGLLVAGLAIPARP